MMDDHLRAPTVIDTRLVLSLVAHAGAKLQRSEVGIFVDAVIAMLEPVETHFMWRLQFRDPADELVLEAAVNGQAETIATLNRRDFGIVPEQFGMSVLTPAKRSGGSRHERDPRAPSVKLH